MTIKWKIVSILGIIGAKSEKRNRSACRPLVAARCVCLFGCGCSRMDFLLLRYLGFFLIFCDWVSYLSHVPVFFFSEFCHWQDRGWWLNGELVCPFFCDMNRPKLLNHARVAVWQGVWKRGLKPPRMLLDGSGKSCPFTMADVRDHFKGRKRRGKDGVI